MTGRWRRSLLVALLGLVFALAQTFSAVHAGGPTGRMSVSVGTGSAGCDGYDHKGGDAKAGGCQPTCASISHALLSAGYALHALDRVQEFVPEPVLSVGRAVDPEPYPPRPLALA